MKPRYLWLAAGVILTTGLAIFGDKATDSQVAEPVVRTQARAAATTAAAPTGPAAAGSGAARPGPGIAATSPATPAILAVIPRAGLQATALGESDQDAALFRGQDWNPLPVPPPAVAPVAPSAPALPFTYIGKAASDGQWQVFLASGEQTLVVHANEIIDGTYRIDAIAPPLLTITYLPLKQIQQLNIGVID